MISHQIIKTALTGSSNGGENPALSVFHWFAAVTQELLEDFAASSPSPRAHSVFETTFEFSFQESITVVVGVDLQSQISVSVNPTIDNATPIINLRCRKWREPLGRGYRARRRSIQTFPREVELREE